MYLIEYVHCHILQILFLLLHNAQAILNHYPNEYRLQKLCIILVLKEKELFLQWVTYFFEDTVLY